MTTRIFKINENAEIVCDSVNTRNGFRHDARLFINGYEDEKAKCCYYNRTWERFKFESVILILLDKTKKLSEAEKTEFKEKMKNTRSW